MDQPYYSSTPSHYLLMLAYIGWEMCFTLAIEPVLPRCPSRCTKNMHAPSRARPRLAHTRKISLRVLTYSGCCYMLLNAVQRPGSGSSSSARRALHGCSRRLRVHIRGVHYSERMSAIYRVQEYKSWEGGSYGIPGIAWVRRLRRDSLLLIQPPTNMQRQ